jgi:hypothetical protein
VRPWLDKTFPQVCRSSRETLLRSMLIPKYIQQKNLIQAVRYMPPEVPQVVPFLQYVAFFSPFDVNFIRNQSLQIFMLGRPSKPSCAYRRRPRLLNLQVCRLHVGSHAGSLNCVLSPMFASLCRQRSKSWLVDFSSHSFKADWYPQLARLAQELDVDSGTLYVRQLYWRQI